MDKQLLAATEKELEDWPGVTFTVEDGGKHPKVVLDYKGETRFVVTASTPSDNRALPNHLATLRREIRALGAERKHVVVGKAKPAPKPANPVLREVPKIMEKKLMTTEAKLDAIFEKIGDLRYAEMLLLAEFMRDSATEAKLQRGNVNSWAKFLQSGVDAMAADRREHPEARQAA